MAALSTYRFNIKYRAGHSNRDADGLSRQPQAPPQEDVDFLQEKERIEAMAKRVLEGEEREIPTDAISALCHCHMVISTKLPVLVESLAAGASSVPELFASPGQTTLPGMMKEGWQKAQREDPLSSGMVSSIEGALIEKTLSISLCCLHNIERELFTGYTMKSVTWDLSVS